MLINHIKTKNFKNFDDIEVNFRKLNVIVGANASGKSNFIQAIRFIRDTQKHGIENAISLQGGLDYLQNIKLKGEVNTEISIGFQSGGVSIIEKTPKNTLILSDYKTIEYKLEIGRKSKNKFSIVDEVLEVTVEFREIDKSLLDNRLLSRAELIEKSHYLSNQIFKITKNRRGRLKISQTPNIKNIDVKLKSGDAYKISPVDVRLFPLPIEMLEASSQPQKTIIEQFPLPMLDFDEVAIYDFDLKSTKRPASITSKVELEENGENLAIVIKNILDDKEQTRKFVNYFTDILPFIKELDFEKSYNKSLLFKVKEKFNPDTYIPSSLLSDGTVSIASIITALFFEEKKLAIFEEPEQGVHPSLIAKLMQLYYEASEKKQIIITTHSPEVVKHTKIEDLLLIIRDGSGFANLSRPSEKEMVKNFLQNELGIDELFVQNLLEI